MIIYDRDGIRPSNLTPPPPPRPSLNSCACSLAQSPPENISLRDNRLTDVPLGVVISALDGGSLLTLDLSENRLGKVAMGRLCAFLSSEPCLEVRVLLSESEQFSAIRNMIVL